MQTCPVCKGFGRLSVTQKPKCESHGEETLGDCPTCNCEGKLEDDEDED
jgi:hypothetical protein